MSGTQAAGDPEQALYRIQSLQFSDLNAANAKLTEFFSGILPFRLLKAKIIPRAVSLNSMSGSLISNNGDRYFFKTHVEPDSVLREYYNVTLLQEAGYPIVAPVFADHKPGQQIVVYPYIKHRTVFELAEEADLHDAEAPDLLQAQIASDKQLFEIYSRTLKDDGAAPESPIHQLFYYRLAGQRFQDFYSKGHFLVDEKEMTFAEIANYRWVINGVEYEQTLHELIEAASTLLDPKLSWGATIIGHGDAHNGNFFLDEKKTELIYFDPAFAGRHSPLLDLVKPLFHNIFATWMYHPSRVASKLFMRCNLVGGRIEINHDYRPSKLRQQMLNSKLTNVLRPLLKEESAAIKAEDSLKKMRLALLCCPLLTVNLSNRDKFPPSIALLALSQCIEIASSKKTGTNPFDVLTVN